MALPLGSGLASFSLQIQLRRDKEKWCPYGAINDQRFKASTEGSTALPANMNHIHHGRAMAAGKPSSGVGRMLVGMERDGTSQAWVASKLGIEM